MVVILLGIIAIILWCVGQAICDLKEILRPISEYYFEKKRNQLNETINVRIIERDKE